ncbi:MAG TPA: RsmD family RNA methyltransferase, partial [Acidimicrobiales bacterium]|nr:RsmD family RNA methyltransferase [Acidimicrobiales bacterium]
MLRVIGGDAKGRRLVAPPVEGLRPTSERVREAMFDILESRDLVAGAVVLDLFSGSGALGIEALSRGAAGVTFVEQDRRAVLAIER